MRAPRLSLTQRLFILTIFALVPTLAILLYNVVELRRSREREVHDLAFRAGQTVQLEMERIISGVEAVLLSLAHAPVVRAFDDACGTYFDDVDRQLPQIGPIVAIDVAGVVRCPAGLAPSDANRADRPYFSEVIRTGRFTVGEFTTSRMTGRPTVPLAAPIRNDAGDVIGVIATGLDLDWLGERLRERTLGAGGAVTVADRAGVVIAREPFSERFIGTRIPDQFQPLVNAEAPGTLEILSRDGTERVIGYFPAPLQPFGLYVSAGLSTDEAFRSIDEATYRGLGLAALACLMAFLSAWLIGRSLFRTPVRRILATIRAWRRGDASARTGMARGSDELESVGFAIDAFMDELVEQRALRRGAEEQRSLLVAELNHRVKNLLATVQAVASQTFRNERDPAENLEGFSRRLAAMAKTHDLLVTGSWESADLAETVDVALDLFESKDARRFDVSGPTLTLRAQAALALSMALHELCTNSVKYGALGAAEGRVRIRWSLEPDALEASFLFSWTETGGPMVRPPTQKGFGSRMIERALAAELSADVDLSYPPEGVVCVIRAKASSALAGAAPAF